MRFTSALLYDVKLQQRHGFYIAYGLITMVYIIFLRLLPLDVRETVDIVLTFSDPSVLGFFFIGGLVLLEKGQGIYDNLFVTPYKPEEYIWSKTLSLSLLSVLTSTIIHLSVFGGMSHAFYFISGVMITSMFFTLIGIGVAVRCQTLNSFFMLASVYSFVFIVPLVEVVGLWHSPLLSLLPSKGSLLLLSSSFKPIPLLEIVYAYCILIVWTVLAYRWAKSSFRKFIILNINGVK
ncbi:ABC transporter permease [Paenibacillus albiflavus]|uniref:ABC transporter permease n=1 Tax=Paenibacillus albiflavus TaxID=2545760 RepID=A0A4R4ENS0_9BACL|nr:ABC transporter permease [Paenibacillus albiflavus]TCZ80085.1 ABC transporter permease [Paenibacillus albiflavus]